MSNSRDIFSLLDLNNIKSIATLLNEINDAHSKGFKVATDKSIWIYQTDNKESQTNKTHILKDNTPSYATGVTAAFRSKK